MDQGDYKPENYIRPFKNVSNSYTDPSLNEVNPRCFKDDVTTLFVNKLFMTTNPQELRIMLPAFLDYTYHTIQSTLATSLTEKIIQYNKEYTDLHINITPLDCNEHAFVIFKGGTLMNLMYENYLENIDIDLSRNQLPDLGNIKINGNYITPLNFDIERKDVIKGMTDSSKSFFGIIGKKFATSDTDYSLYIDAKTSERFNIIQFFAIPLIATALQVISNKFESYYECIVNVNNECLDSMSDYNLDLVDTPERNELLRAILDTFKKIIKTDIIDGIGIVSYENYVKCMFFLNICVLDMNICDIHQDHIYSINHNKLHNLYDMYTVCEIISYIKYLNFSQYAELYGDEFDKILIPPLEQHLNHINRRDVAFISVFNDSLLENIKTRILRILDNKFKYLVINNFYTKKKFEEANKQLAADEEYIKGKMAEIDSIKRMQRAMRHIDRVSMKKVMENFEYFAGMTFFTKKKLLHQMIKKIIINSRKGVPVRIERIVWREGFD